MPSDIGVKAYLCCGSCGEALDTFVDDLAFVDDKSDDSWDSELKLSGLKSVSGRAPAGSDGGEVDDNGSKAEPWNTVSILRREEEEVSSARLRPPN